MKWTIPCLALLAWPFLAFAQIEKPASEPAAAKGATPLSPAHSLTRSPAATRAVVVGISDYQDAAIPDLRFADRDAEAFANFLRSPAGGSLDGDHLKVLTNQNATAGRIAEALDGLIEQAKEGDQVIIYFSGHGDVERKTVSQPGFLLCWDAPARVYMGGGTYSLAFLQEIVTTLSTQNGAKVTVITDACHAGKLSGSQIGGAQLTSANLARQYANEVKILSCQPNEFSLEGEQWGGGRGCFSYHLVDGLFGLADRNEDDLVTVGELDRYLEDHVTAEAAPQSQVPMLLGNKTERLATVHAAVLADLKKNKASGLPVFAAIEGRGFEDDILSKLDSGIVKRYFAFKKAVAEKRFLPDASTLNPQPSADELYASLSAEPGLAPLYGFMKRNYAAALQDDAQQVLNEWMKTSDDQLLEEAAGGGKERLPQKVFTEKVRSFPRLLERAAELLGQEHYMYAVLQARKYFFEGYLLTNADRNPNRALGEQALTAFRKALDRQAELPQAYWQMSRVYGYNLLQPDSAEVYAQKAMELNPSWVLPCTDLAFIFSNKYKQFDRAKPWLEQAMQLDSNSTAVRRSWGVYFYNKKEYVKAEQQFIKAIQLDSTFASAYNSLGNVYEEIRRYAEAEQQFKKAIRLDSTFAGAYNNLGNVYREIRRYAEAEQQFIKAIQLDSTFAGAYNNLGYVYREIRRYAEAEQQCKKAIRLDSTHVNAYNNLGLVYRNTSRYAEAEQQLKKALQLDSTYVKGYYNLGKVYSSTRRYAEAEQQYKKAIQFDSTYVFAYYNLACRQSQQNRTDAAFGYLGKALKFGYDNYDWMQEDSDLAPLREQKDRWETLMQNALVPDSTDATAWNKLGQLYIRALNYAPAEAAMRKAVALDATSAPFRSNLGFVYLNLGRYPEAEAALKKAITLDSTYANPRKHLGMVCFKTNRPEEARQHLLKALELNPNYLLSYLGMARLLFSEGKTEEAIGYVEQAIGKGVTYAQLESDEDLAPLRTLPEWKALMKKYFPDQVKD